MSGIAYIAFPQFTSVYPWFLVWKITTNIGTVLAFNAPFLPDYFDQSSTGLASSFIQVTTTLSTLVTSSFIPYINSKLDDIKWVFYAVGIATLICVIELIFGLKEVIVRKNVKL